jgi:glycosyltransferase involved in cell wall biosynthesis
VERSQRRDVGSPCVTVAIPVYNAGAFISSTILSVLDQPMTDFKLFIYDNALTDNTREVVRSFSGQKISVVGSDKNRGAHLNWNTCLSQINGRYFKLVCADDVIARNCLARQV